MSPFETQGLSRLYIPYREFLGLLDTVRYHLGDRRREISEVFGQVAAQSGAAPVLRH